MSGPGATFQFTVPIASRGRKRDRTSARRHATLQPPRIRWSSSSTTILRCARRSNGLFRSVGLRAEVFGSAPELLQSELPDVASCLVLDIRLPKRSGLDFQAELAKAEIEIPIIFITGHGDVPMSVRAMKAGAVDFLTKPFRDQDLLDAVAPALERDRDAAREEQGRCRAEGLVRSLTPREQEVMALGHGRA